MHHGQAMPGCCCSAQASGRFTKFRRLPPEIRNMIWEFALPEARVYEVLDAPNAKQKTPAHEGLMFANVYPEPPPALAAPLTLGKTTKFVDMSRDILLLEPYLLVKRLHRTLHFMSQISLVRDKATQLALGTSYGVYTGIFHPVLGRKVSKNNMSKLLASLAKFSRLKTLIFVVHQEFQFEFDFRFPGTLTPMPSMLMPTLNTGLGSSYGAVPAATGYPSPHMIRDDGSAKSSRHSITADATKTTFTGLPTPASSTGNSPLPPSSLPLPSIPQQQTLPFFQPLHFQQQQNQQQQQQQQHHQPHATLLPLLEPTTTTSLAAPPLPLPPPPPPHQKQQVHQAYRFKFDMQASVAAPPRRPHANEFLYYPLENAPEGRGRDEFDEYEAYVEQSSSSSSGQGTESHGGLGPAGWGYGERSGGLWDCVGDGAGGLGEGSDDGEEGEWCDPWPTNDDWRRFRRRWVRAMVAACVPAAGAGNSGRDWDGVGDEGAFRGESGKSCGGNSGEKGVAGTGGRDGICLPKWKLKGASLLWRYTRGVGGVQ
ncbi:hypothetical protein C7999DRAFT_13841 [Corynascus novoguineensis]|uniref:2EXR domain-containing protein n=1 Tax=Corynascus novoguineensis TaxID=1126955 RepID=A0AAN7CTS1_9PEZI|nr:hypothetical protein C7999DRAFT_13841 [Corynascus novoguineensis]